MLKTLLAMTLGLTGALAFAADGPNSVEAPPVQDLGNGKFKVGIVGFEQKTRQISFPAEVNMKEGALEYAIVHQNGKIHEAIPVSYTHLTLPTSYAV